MIPNAFELAQQQHQAGRLNEAEQLYRQILSHAPTHAPSLHYLGLLAHQAGHHVAAVDLIRQSLAINPNAAEAHNSLGMALAAADRRHDAVAAFRRAIAINPNLAEFQANLGKGLASIGHYDDAIGAYHNAIALRPETAELFCGLGRALKNGGRIDDAIAAYERAIALRPDYPEALNYLGAARRENGQIDEAIAACQKAVALRPNYAEAHVNLGVALRDKGALTDSIAACRTAVELSPGIPAALGNLANALKDSGEIEEAIDFYRQTIALQPDLAEAHNNLAIALLLTRQFQEGWREHEWRWQCKRFPSPRRFFNKPIWDGNSLSGGTILIHSEQGLGDAIQYVRYVPVLSRRGARVIFECQGELTRLMRHVVGMEGIEIVPRQKLDASALPPFDTHVPLMSLPFLTGIPEPTAELPHPPYITVSDEMRDAWRRRLEGNSRLKVGLVWAGSPGHAEDNKRSIALRAFEPLLRSNADFYSLQLGEASKQIWNGSGIINLTSEISDFLDTAAMISQLDLVICVDTAVTHLAGALNKPTWVMIRSVPDFRWQLDREDSPWYPSVRIFRQKKAGEWAPVIYAVADALGSLIERMKGHHPVTIDWP